MIFKILCKSIFLAILLFSVCDSKGADRKNNKKESSSKRTAYKANISTNDISTEKYEKNIQGSSSIYLSNSLLQVKPYDFILGKKNSKVNIISYLSPTCFACAMFHKRIFPVIKSKYIDTNKVLYISREIIASRQDFYAAILARCKNSTDAYFKYLNILFNKQSTWAYSKNYYSILSNIGAASDMSQNQYDSCLNSKELKNLLLSYSYDLTQKYNIKHTPVILINGELIRPDLTIITQKIDKLLSDTHS